MLTLFLLATAIFLAYANGANDNFKGVATLYGSNTLSYKVAITIATIATFLGSVCAIFLAQALVVSFSGKGLVPQSIAGTSAFLVAVGFGAAITVLLATKLGFPISTTHGLVGGLLGAGIISVGQNVNFAQLNSTFLIPLLVSPIIAIALGAIIYKTLTLLRKRFNITKESCVCVGEQKQFIPITTLSSGSVYYTEYSRNPGNDKSNGVINPIFTVANVNDCVDLYTDRVWGITVQKLLNVAHIISGSMVSFARGLNDTPKIAGLLFVLPAINLHFSMIILAIGMAIGGLLNARNVAETMSKKITNINHGQGLSANLVTAFLVLVASKFGVPVSTTHVSVGSIFGIGLVNGKSNTAMVRNILLSWVITLPVAMVISGISYLLTINILN